MSASQAVIALARDARTASERGRPEQAWDLAHDAASSADPQLQRYALSVLRALVLPHAAWTEPRRNAAKRLGVPIAAHTHALGRVSFPVVGGAGDRFATVQVELCAERDRLPALDGPTIATIQAALQAARAQASSAQHLAVSFAPATGWSGTSCGLAVALAAVSCLLAQPLSEDLIATGEVAATGEVLAVGHMRAKLQLRDEARPRARFLVPIGDDVAHPAVLPVASLLAAAQAADLEPAVDLTEQLGLVRTHDQHGDWLKAAREAERLESHPDLTDDERAELHVVLLLAANHAADTDAQARWSHALSANQHVLSGLHAARAFGSQIVRCVDALDVDGATAVLTAATLAWSPAERLHIDGPAALLATLCGRFDAAVALRRASVQAALPDERARCLGDLADALARAGQLDEALAVADSAIAHAAAINRRRPYQRSTLNFLNLHRGRILAFLGYSDDARAALQAIEPTGIDPLLRARLALAELDGDLDAVTQAAAELPTWASASPIFQALLLRSRARLGDTQAAEQLAERLSAQGRPHDDVSKRLPY